LAQERHTIDVRVKQEAKVTASEMLKTNQGFLQQQRERQRLEDKRDERMRKWMNWVIEAPKKTVNTWMFVVAWALICGGWGWVVGINTPNWIVCLKQRSLCYQARFIGGNSGRQAIDTLPKPQCVQTSKGLACLLEPVRKIQPKTRNHH